MKLIFGIVKELERVHPVEAIFVVVTFGFMLEEFAASKEHGWTGRCLPFSHLPLSISINDWEEMLIGVSVYSANVSRYIMNHTV